MKVNGVSLAGYRVVSVDMPTESGIVTFKFRALAVNEKFEDVMPRPNAPVKMAPGGVKHVNVDDPGYKIAIDQWANKKLAWEFLKSISETEGLEWETVKLEDPETWENWQTEIKGYFGVGGQDRLFSGFVDAQYINEETIERCRKRFLTGLQAPSA
jgi:TusA-related sulfurtransferase